ncbi:DNA excision repair protein ERCC-8-like [Acanthaster planci]|uniref:DNA excision repair protein ERCC-8 n=1 Tax=Acanthaster planci TaxID=133434 RepID=A0A8B7Y2E4_ACAPL|nr:DNA excision repair protein ERCC-8-like [Acanthaster planci]
MLSFLESRRNGTRKPESMVRAEVTRRTFCLELSKGRDVQRIHQSGINTLDIDPTEGRYLLSGGSMGVIAVFDIEAVPAVKEVTCEAVCTVGRSNKHVHKRSVETVQWYPHDTGMFTSSSTDCLLKVWDTNALVPAETFTMDKPIYSHNMSPIATKHCLIGVASQSSHITLCDLKTGSATHILKGHRAAVMCLKWSPKQEFLLASGSQDNKLLLWDVRRAKSCLMALDQHNGEAVGHSSAAVRTAHSGHVNGLSFTDDGLRILSFGTDDRLRLWDVATGKNTLVNFGKVTNDGRKNVKIAISSGAVPDAAFVPNTADVAVFDLHNGELVYDLKGHYSNVNCCVFHPLFQELYSGGNDSNILLWEPDEGRVVDLGEEKEEKQKKGRTFYGQTMTATEDTWSSDEDG